MKPKLPPFHIQTSQSGENPPGWKNSFNRTGARTYCLGTMLALLLGLTVAGCQKAEPEGPSPQLLTLVAKWRGGQMTLGECLHFFRELHTVSDVDPKNMDESVGQLINEWVGGRILWERAKEQGLDRDPKYLDKIRPLEEEWLVSLLVRKEVEEPVVLNDSSLQRYYQDNPEEYMSPALYSYYRIFFSNAVHGPEVAEERARKCWGSLDMGANFNELVEEYSDTPHDKRYLSYGPFRPGENPAEIEEVIMQTPVRGYSPVVKLPNGFMIISPTRKDEAVPKPFEKVKGAIAKKLYEERRQTALEEYLQVLSGKYQIEPHRELFNESNPKPEAVVLKIGPGAGVFTWQKFMDYLKAKNQTDRSQWDAAFEEFAKRMLLIHHARQTDFKETAYFKTRFRAVEVRVLSDYLLEITIDAVTEPTEEEMQAFYESHPTLFERPARAEAWHIVRKIEIPENASERDKINAGLEAEGQLTQIRHLIMEQGHSFVTWANRFSQSDDGGYMGYVTLMAMSPEWVAVTAFLAEGEISQPFRYGETFEMIMKGRSEEAGLRKYEEAREDVRIKTRLEKIAVARGAELDRVLTETGMIYEAQPIVDLIVRLSDRLNRPPSYWRDPYR